jgi:type III pantothenate kinase
MRSFSTNTLIPVRSRADLPSASAAPRKSVLFEGPAAVGKGVATDWRGLGLGDAGGVAGERSGPMQAATAPADAAAASCRKSRLLYRAATSPTPGSRVPSPEAQASTGIIEAMWLAVNVGNTNVKVGRIRDGQLAGSRRVATRTEATPDEIEALLEELLQLDGETFGAVEGAVLASVVPPYGQALTSVLERRGVPLIEATAETIPIPVRVDNPAEVGADRLVNALAAGRLYGAPAIVVDFGTATTFDAVAADGAYVGGAIAPGLEIGLEALASRTAKLPRIELRKPSKAIGTNTVSAMRSGAVFGYLGLTTALLERIRRELGDTSDASDAGTGAAARTVRTILTGGLASASWWSELARVDVVDPDLTLKGLAILHSELTAGIGEPRVRR